MIYRSESIAKEELKDRIKSMGITLFLAVIFLLFLYFYKIVRVRKEEKITTTTMIVNFQTGINSKPPKTTENNKENEIKSADVSIQNGKISLPKPHKLDKKEVSENREKIITGKNSQYKVVKNNPTAYKNEKIKSNQIISKNNSNPFLTRAKESSVVDKSRQQSNTAIGNLIKGKALSKENGIASGRGTDPLALGRASAKVGTGVGDRKLIQFIPGTMGHGGVQPTHSCSAKGTVRISYTVDKSGNVISAYYVSGISEPCAVSTSVSWVKKYVKAEKSTGTSTGIYTIVF